MTKIYIIGGGAAGFALGFFVPAIAAGAAVAVNVVRVSVAPTAIASEATIERAANLRPPLIAGV